MTDAGRGRSSGRGVTRACARPGCDCGAPRGGHYDEADDINKYKYKWQSINECLSLDAHPHVVCADSEASNVLRLRRKHGGVFVGRPDDHDQIQRKLPVAKPKGGGALPIACVYL